jgi:hypothetical protein
MKDLIFVQSCPDDDYFIWQVQLWLESLKELNLSDKAVSLIFTPKYREFNVKWLDLEKQYPESTFKFYKDEKGELTKFISIYIPIIRPYCLLRYFKDNPELENKAIFYCDADVIFTKNFEISQYVDDDINYLSNTTSYIGAKYFDSKLKDVLPDKVKEYQKVDTLDMATSIIGINRPVAEKNQENSGGAQYLLKNINYKFWEKVLIDCIGIRIYLQKVNKEFFKNESKGFQSWAADMWSVLWNLWFFNRETKVVPEMNFAWSSDKIEKLNNTGILHNAGIVSEKQGDIPVFYKGKYHQGKDPFSDPHLEDVYNNEKYKTLCNWYYVSKMIELKNKRNNLNNYKNG